ncbi:transcriptional repressor [Fulvimarina endophytica]|uniref:Ferric uptake regulation protein n=2 Tax=Fulvimarina endophytica TaxID=2293836 RepID=A0A371X8I5_9HYPH|nr:transcriptional repressor [Fulvimarina endophytica]
MLREAGLRVTSQRMAILRTLSSAEDHPTAEEIAGKARGSDASISHATVYRTLSVLEELGLIRKLSLENSPARYELCGDDDHGHIVDVGDGTIIEFEDEAMSARHQAIAADLGYEVVRCVTIIEARKKPGPV